ncbi:hypothetical protein ACFE04_027291 [Oxalis oulophora]
MESTGERALTMEAKTSSSVNVQPTIKYKGIKAMPYILGNMKFEKLEKLEAMGTASNLFVFLIQIFNLKHITAIKVMSVFGGTANFEPLIGAFYSDTYFGRYKTICFASICSVLIMGAGLFLITIVLLVSATVAEYRKHLAPTNTNGSAISLMSAFWLVPQLVLTCLAKGFNSGANGVLLSAAPREHEECRWGILLLWHGNVKLCRWTSRFFGARKNKRRIVRLVSRGS